MRETTVGAVRARLESLGYACTSHSHPDRIIDQRIHFRTAARRASFSEISDHEACIACLPTDGFEHLKDASQRQVVLLTLTAFLLANSKESKPVMSALGKLLSGPYLQQSFGDRVYLVQYNGEEPLFASPRHRARQTHPDDDETIVFEQATRVGESFGQTYSDGGIPLRTVTSMGVQSLYMPLAGRWENGSPLQVPREKLPELLAADVAGIVGECERARWFGRPSAAKDAAAAAA